MSQMGYRQDQLGLRVGWSEVGERMTKYCLALPGRKAAIMEVARQTGR